ncbi:MAG: DoxX family protein, partial [Cyclobacteriaceae bacterium]
KEMVLLNPEAQPKITDYSVWNNEGDFTEQSFEGNRLMVVMYDAQKADTDALPEIKSLMEDLPADVSPVILTASGETIFEAFRHEHQLAIPYYFADATLLKTIIRANPGIVLLKNGVVAGKWHFNDVPDAGQIKEILNKRVAMK